MLANLLWNQTRQVTPEQSGRHACTPARMESLERRQLFAANPLIGNYVGKLTRQDTIDTFPVTISVTAKKGTTRLAFSAVITEAGFGALDISVTISAHSNGAFVASLGAPFTDGVITGHLSHKKLVFSISEPGSETVSGDLKVK
jgi:hypothetical protein